MKTRGVNFDGLMGLTHHYAGLLFGNEASTKHRFQVSSPHLAAEQGLLKVKALADAGSPQVVIPPHKWPCIPVLRQLGFNGNDEQVLERVLRRTSHWLSGASSAPLVWVANAAMVRPSTDSLDGRVYLTVANLDNKFYRLLETPTTKALLQTIFRNKNSFVVRDALPQTALSGDEGTTDHSRLGGDYGDPGVQLLAYGREEGNTSQPKCYPARQSREAGETVARLNQVNPHQRIFAQRNPDVIDPGAFHSDVTTVSSRQVLFCHQQTFARQQALLEQLRSQVAGFTPLEVPTAKMSTQGVVTAYLFNGQLLSCNDGSMMLALPQECQEHAGVWRYLNRLLEGDNPIDGLRVFGLRESMSNGDGSARLHLRVVFTPQEQQAVSPAIITNDTLSNTLNSWVDCYYRDRLTAVDLADPQLLCEGRETLDTLTQLFNLGSVYPLQQEEMHHE